MKDYESTADTAKRVRKALKHYFPTVKFSVRSKVYSGGASIDVRWTDGPRTSSVEQIAKQFEGADFDGMIDLKTHHSTIIVDAGGPHEVQFGADFVFCTREVSNEHALVEQARAIIEARCQIEGTGDALGSVTCGLPTSPAEWSAHSTLRRAPHSRTRSARSSFVNERGCA